MRGNGAASCFTCATYIFKVMSTPEHDLGSEYDALYSEANGEKLISETYEQLGHFEAAIIAECRILQLQFAMQRIKLEKWKE
jgi:hypothetical protein